MTVRLLPGVKRCGLAYYPGERLAFHFHRARGGWSLEWGPLKFIWRAAL